MSDKTNTLPFGFFLRFMKYNIFLYYHIKMKLSLAMSLFTILFTNKYSFLKLK